MKLKKILSLSFATAALTFAVMPTNMAYATEPARNMSTNVISPRFRYIEYISAGVYPSSSGTEYDLEVRGTTMLKSISGTATLYKKTSTGSYTRIDSEKFNLNGSHILYTGYLASSGAGTYKIEIDGTAHYTDGTTEDFSISKTNSY